MNTSRLLAAAYALLGLLAIMVLARVMPPFQNPDELAHVLRAEQVGRGGLLGRRFETTHGVMAGGLLDGGAAAVYAVFEPLVFHPQVQASREMFDRAATVVWGGAPRWQHFENTGVYPPFLYVPAAAAIELGRLRAMPVVRTLHMARLAGGLAAVGLGTAAVALAGGAAPFVFALLSLPMSLSLMAAVSQDALLLPVCGLAAALLVRLRAPAARPAGRGAEFFLLCLCLALAGMARPAYLPVAALPLAAGVPWRWRAAGAGGVAACVLGWSALAAQLAMVNGSEAGLADAGAQAALLWAEPSRVWRVAAATLAAHGRALAEGFVWRLGWLDLALPGWLRRVGVGSLLLGALASSAPVAPCVASTAAPDLTATGSLAGRVWLARGRAARVRVARDLAGRGLAARDWGRELAVLVAAASVGALAALLYLTWTPVGLGVVMGLQGRYFLPAALLLAMALPQRPVLPAAALALPFGAAVMLAGVVWEVVARYYLR